jgi:hypothetical protein
MRAAAGNERKREGGRRAGRRASNTKKSDRIAKK